MFEEDLALKPVNINFSPGVEYWGKSRKWQGIPGIERAANERLWAVRYSGGCTEVKAGMSWSTGNKTRMSAPLPHSSSACVSL